MCPLTESVYRENSYTTREVFPIVGTVHAEMQTRLIAFGNTLLRDDGVGIHVARALRASSALASLQVVESEVGGLALLELLEGCDRAVLVDAVQLPGRAAGELVPLALSDARASSRLAGVHEADLPAVLEIGARLGHGMPSQVVVFGIQGEDLTTFGERLTPAVEAALPRLVEELLGAIAKVEEDA